LGGYRTRVSGQTEDKSERSGGFESHIFHTHAAAEVATAPQPSCSVQIGQYQGKSRILKDFRLPQFILAKWSLSGD
jgi:hypothetical protein